ncbi:MAG TPA: penicillin acylase family protein, partial [Puia sp.]|nr:penicillin acylase family protein [Puia sp.]
DIYNDLLIRLIIDTSDAKRDFASAPVWLKKLCVAFADGVNYFLYNHPGIKPALLTQFQPWYPFLWTDGSIGAIKTAGMGAANLRDFYDSAKSVTRLHRKGAVEEATGSNGFAFAPSITSSHHAILYINPHVTFYFRPEIHMASNEGLNAYGAVTWGQFFVYQGFNQHCAWMHTSSEVDVADSYLEKISFQSGNYFYTYEHESRPVVEKKITIVYKAGDSMKHRIFTGYFTHHGPVMGRSGNQWISVRSYNRSLNGLMQCWLRTKTTSFKDFKKVLDLRGNVSNNTVYADAEGNIAYWHGNYVPVRDTAFDWSMPVDGSTAATEWKGIHAIDQIIHVYNPANGWLQNCNSSPFSAAGQNSPKKQDFPKYMAPDGENFRSVTATRILAAEKNYTIDKVIAKGYDRHLAAFDQLVPALAAAWAQAAADDSLNNKLREPVKILMEWDRNSGAKSVATNLAIEWGQRLLRDIIHPRDGFAGDFVAKTEHFARTATADQLLLPLAAAVDAMKARWGRWDMPWGEINRYQRNTGEIRERYDDAVPSLPVGFASSLWGQIPSYASIFFPGTKHR